MNQNATDLLARRIGADSIIETTAAGSGHPVSSRCATTTAEAIRHTP